MMFTDCLVIRSNIIPCPRESTGIHSADAAAVFFSRAQLGVRIIQRIIINQVKVKTSLEFQSLNNRSFQKSTTGNFIFHSF